MANLGGREHFLLSHTQTWGPQPGLPLAQRDDCVQLPLPHWMELEAASELQAWEEVLGYR